jgi:hypothetical protein
MEKTIPRPNFGAQYYEPLMRSISQGTKAPEIPASAFNYQGYDLNQVMQHYTAQALKDISPTAAQIASGPNALPTLASLSPGINVQQALNRQNYRLPPQSGGGAVTININAGQTDQGVAPAAPTSWTPPSANYSYAGPPPWTGATPQPLPPEMFGANYWPA